MPVEKARNAKIERVDGDDSSQDGTAYYPRPPRNRPTSIWTLSAVYAAQLIFGIAGTLATGYVMFAAGSRDYKEHYRYAECAAFVLICLAFVAGYVYSNLRKSE